MTEKYIRISIDIPSMRGIQVIKGDLTIKEKVEVIYERRITRFGNSAKIDAMKKYIGKRAYVIIVKD
jgi:putative transposon-encoded protein